MGIAVSCKTHKLAHPPVLFNNVTVKRCSIPKHLGIHLDEKFNFNHHVKEKMTEEDKGIGVIKKLSNTLPRDALLTIYKSFVRPHLDYGDIIYDQPQNAIQCSISYHWSNLRDIKKRIRFGVFGKQKMVEDSVHSIKLKHIISHPN